MTITFRDTPKLGDEHIQTHTFKKVQVTLYDDQVFYVRQGFFVIEQGWANMRFEDFKEQDSHFDLE